jgi:aminodeoxyfutalosine deaminase
VSSHAPDAILLLRAGWAAPMDRPPIRDGAVVHTGGLVVAVGPAAALRRDYPTATIEDVGPDAVVLPGLVNPHTHLELSLCEAGDSPGGSFTDWIQTVRTQMKLDPDDIAGSVGNAVRRGVEQSIGFGVTTLGDVSQQSVWTRAALRETPVRAVSYGEALGLAQLRFRYEELLASAIDDTLATDRLRVGLTPHAPYTVDLDGYRQCVEVARERNLPLKTHLAETADEAAFLARQEGPFRQVWEDLGMWDETVPKFDGGPIRFAQAVGMLDYQQSLLAHVNFCDDEELAILAGGKASVVYCPRTHKYFGHPPHRWREMLARGINVAVGTDSCASSPNLDIAADLRLLRKLAPEVPAETLWSMATTRAARALGLHDEVGSLEPGKHADFAVFTIVRSANPLEDLLRADAPPPATAWIGGSRVAIPTPQ